MLIRRFGRARHAAGGRRGDGGGLRARWPPPMNWRFISSAVRWRAWALPCSPPCPAPICWPRTSAVPISPSGFISPSAGWAAWPARSFISSPSRSAAAGAISGLSPPFCPWPRRVLSAAAGGYQNRPVAGRRRNRGNHQRKLERSRPRCKTPQFAVLAAAYSVFLIVDITVNAWSVAHLMRPWRRPTFCRQHAQRLALHQCRRAAGGRAGVALYQSQDIAGRWRWPFWSCGLVALVRRARPAHDAGLCRRHRHRLGPDLLCLHHPAAGLFRPRPQSGAVFHRQSDLHRGLGGTGFCRLYRRPHRQFRAGFCDSGGAGVRWCCWRCCG